MPSRWISDTNGGTVDSPTPIVPSSSDSTSSISQTSRFRCWLSIAAASQPDVPPPTMTILERGFTSPVPVFHHDPRALLGVRRIVVPVGRTAGLNGLAQQVDGFMSRETHAPGQHQAALRHRVRECAGGQEI